MIDCLEMCEVVFVHGTTQIKMFLLPQYPQVTILSMSSSLAISLQLQLSLFSFLIQAGCLLQPWLGFQACMLTTHLTGHALYPAPSSGFAVHIINQILPGPLSPSSQAATTDQAGWLHIQSHGKSCGGAGIFITHISTPFLRANFSRWHAASFWSGPLSAFHPASGEAIATTEKEARMRDDHWDLSV